LLGCLYSHENDILRKGNQRGGRGVDNSKGKVAWMAGEEREREK
jgi:hypothetical protein